MMNRTVDMQALQENPPIFAPKGFFKEDYKKIFPGIICEYGDELSPDKITPMQFASGTYLNDITYISDLMAEISGVFPNMAGADETKAKTATEISTKAQGQLTRLSMSIDSINQGLIIPVVKNVAKLLADFKTGDEDIYIDNGSNKETVTINDSIRKGDYDYTYSDRSATTERSNKADMVVGACQQFAQFMPLDAEKLFVWYMGQKDVENPERFIQQQQLLEPEVQQALMQNPQLAPIIEQMQQNVLAQKQQQAGNAAPQNYQDDTNIPQGAGAE